MAAREQGNVLLPSIGIFVGGAMWGLIWLPLRAIGDHGLQAVWPGGLVYAATALLLLPLFVLRWRHLRGNLGQLVICGMLTGSSFSLYATAILTTDVVRAILLFYLSPIWGTVLGAIFLGERITVTRVMALVLGLLGMVVILSGEGGGFGTIGVGDVLALISGLSWALGSLQLYRMGHVAVSDKVLAFIAGSVVTSVITLALGGDIAGAIPSSAQLTSALPVILATGFYLLPMLFLTIWPATVLTPARIGLLLMSDVVVGVLSAAWLSGEPFGTVEAIGAVLIVGAGLVEVLGPFLTRANLRKLQDRG